MHLPILHNNLRKCAGQFYNNKHKGCHGSQMYSALVFSNPSNIFVI